jgi:hypothetical protein
MKPVFMNHFKKNLLKTVSYIGLSSYTFASATYLIEYQGNDDIELYHHMVTCMVYTILCLHRAVGFFIPTKTYLHMRRSVHNVDRVPKI